MVGWLWQQVLAVEVLRRAWLFPFYVEGDHARWRTAADLAPAGQRINSHSPAVLNNAGKPT